MVFIGALPKIDRPINAREIAVIRAALERPPTQPLNPHAVASIDRLYAVAKCPSGCDSVNFAPHAVSFDRDFTQFEGPRTTILKA
jgi:hypothetical protein